MKTLIVDGNNLAHRSQFAQFRVYRDEDVSIPYGCIANLMYWVGKFEPDNVLMVWDGGISKRRRALIPSYKQSTKRGSKADMEFFKEQTEKTRQMLRVFGVANLIVKGVEADDLIWLASRQLRGDCLIVSTDNDLLQCLTPDGRVSVFSPLKKKTITWKTFSRHFSVHPAQFLDYKILMGDSSDNLSGIKGIGEKLAIDILYRYGNINLALRAAYHADTWDISTRARTALQRADPEHIRRTRTVMQLSGDIPEDTVQKSVSWGPVDHKKAKQELIQRGFFKLIDSRLGKDFGRLTEPLPWSIQPYRSVTLTQIRRS